MNNTRNECKNVEENGVNIDTESLRKLAEQGDGKAQHLLATMDLDEDWSYYPINDPKFAVGLEWVRKDADAGNPISQYQYGEILIWACDIEKTMNEGLEYLKRSCENGYARAAVELGLLYENMAGSDWGDVFQPDLNEARKWFEKGVDLGSMFACDKLGELLYYDAVNAFVRISSGVSIEGDAALIDRTPLSHFFELMHARPSSRSRFGAGAR